VLYKKTAKEIARNIIISPYHFEKHARNHILNQFKYTFKDVKQGWYNYIYGHKSSVLGGGFLLNPFMLGAAGDIGGWKELDRDTLGADGDVMTVNPANKRLYQCLIHRIQSGSSSLKLTCNNDTETNYTRRNSVNGEADGTGTSKSSIGMNFDDPDVFANLYVSNYSSKEKLLIGHTSELGAAGAGNAPARHEFVGKWANTTDAISEIDITNDGAGSYASGSEFVILGLDPADTHTDNFWGQLFSPVDATGSVTQFDSGTFTAKKYIRVMGYVVASSTGALGFRFNDDTGNNYTGRWSENGGADQSASNQSFTRAGAQFPSGGSAQFFDAFIINVSNKEKLLINHSVTRNASGSGSAPTRFEHVGKWANTSAQITKILISNLGEAGNYTKWVLSGWGSD